MVLPQDRLSVLHIYPLSSLFRVPTKKLTQHRNRDPLRRYCKRALTLYGSSSVTVVGHSLGAALALLDGISLSLHLLANVKVRVIGYGMPRVGNQAFAIWVDSHLDVTHINNREDPIPIVPSKLWGFVHPSGEVLHITDSGIWESCPGVLFSTLVISLGRAGAAR